MKELAETLKTHLDTSGALAEVTLNAISFSFILPITDLNFFFQRNEVYHSGLMVTAEFPMIQTE